MKMKYSIISKAKQWQHEHRYSFYISNQPSTPKKNQGNKQTDKQNEKRLFPRNIQSPRILHETRIRESTSVNWPACKNYDLEGAISEEDMSWDIELLVNVCRVDSISGQHWQTFYKSTDGRQRDKFSDLQDLIPLKVGITGNDLRVLPSYAEKY